MLQSAGTVAVLHIDAAGAVTDSGTRIPLGAGSPAYAGVDQITTTPSGVVLVHVAGAVGGGGSVAVIDPETNAVVRTIAVPGPGGAGGGIAAIPW